MEEREVITLCHWDDGAIVAIVNRIDGEIFDWAVYKGNGTPAEVAQSGDKLLARDARWLAPDLPIGKYRE